MAKIVYGWVADWNEHPVAASSDWQLPKDKGPNVTIDLFFSSKQEFASRFGGRNPESEILVPVWVGDDFNDLDYIPDNY